MNFDGIGKFKPYGPNQLTTKQQVEISKRIEHLKKDRQAETESTHRKLREFYAAIDKWIDQCVDENLDGDERDLCRRSIERRRFLSTLLYSSNGEYSDFFKKFMRGRDPFPDYVEKFLKIQAIKHQASCESFPDMDEATKFPWVRLYVELSANGWSYESIYLFLHYLNILDPAMSLTVFRNRIIPLKGYVRLAQVNIRAEYTHIMQESRKKRLQQAIEEEDEHVIWLKAEMQKLRKFLSEMAPDENPKAYASISSVLESHQDKYRELTGRTHVVDLEQQVEKKVVMSAVDDKIIEKRNEGNLPSLMSDAIGRSLIIDVDLIEDFNVTQMTLEDKNEQEQEQKQ